MPVEVVVDAKTVDKPASDGLEKLADRLLKNLERVSYLRARRKPPSRGRPSPPLAAVVRVSVAPNEDAAFIVDRAVESIAEAIVRDADGNEWRGEVQVYDEDDKVFDSVDVLFEADAQPERPTKDSELVGILSVLRVHLGDMAKTNVDLAKSLASCGVAFKDVIQSVATTSGEEARARYEYEWKMQESRERMHETEVEAEASVHRSTATKFMMGGLLERYQPTLDTLAQMFAAREGVKTGPRKPMPPRPTEEEVLRVLPLPTDASEDRYADIRSVALAMLRCRDPLERPGIQQAMLVELSRLGSQLLVMQAEGERILGVERFAQVIGWFRAPWD